MTDASVDDVVPLLVARTPTLIAEIRDALRVPMPGYARFLAERETEVVASATAVVHRVVALADDAAPPGIGSDTADPDPERVLFEEVGRVQSRAGRDLAELLSAYRLGVRVFWHHVSAAALEVGLAPDELAALAEAVFVFVDRLSSISAHGYVLEQGEVAAARERHRDELVSLLLSERADAEAVRAAAGRAGWDVPDEVAVVLVPPDDVVGARVLDHLDASALPFRRPTMTGAIVPYPSRTGDRAALRRLLQGGHATVGAAVGPENLPASVRVAEIAARLRSEKVLDDDPVFAAEHLDAIIVHRDQRLLDALRRQVLEPLASSTPASQERLRETLLSWLRNMGDRRAMAAELHVHPQTVRYRLGRLHEIYGPVLDDPDTRARLLLALGWPG